MRQPLYIFGAGGLGREVLSFVKFDDRWEIRGFFDDSTLHPASVKGIPVIGGIDALNNVDREMQVVIALGDPTQKISLRTRITNHRVIFPTLIHPRAIIQDVSEIKIGQGCIITAGVVLTTEIEIGDHILLNLNSTVGHQSKIGSYTSVMPGANIAGNVRIEQQVLIGSGANIRNGVHIGRNSKVGMGAVVIDNVPPEVTVVGVPAKII